MSTLKPLQIDIVSDVVCPWCYIGKRRIENALALVPDVPVHVQLAAVLPQSVDPARGHRSLDLSGDQIRFGGRL